MLSPNANLGKPGPENRASMFRNPVTDVVVVLVIVLLIFGPKRLPQLGRSLGQGMREFKDSITGDSKGDGAEERPELTQTSSPETSSGAAASPPASAPEPEAASAEPSPEREAASAERHS